MTFTENVKNEDENYASLQNTPFSSEKHKNNHHLNNRRSTSMLISNCFSFSVAALIISLLIAFFSLQYYLPKALDHCSCVKEEFGRLYNSSSIGYPKMAWGQGSTKLRIDENCVFFVTGLCLRILKLKSRLRKFFIYICSHTGD
uniref:Uncharacterized protein n=1 Tax=Meloidogyne incognita TaxID=6306 RepID=A0A914LTM6_MELIC